MSGLPEAHPPVAFVYGSHFVSSAVVRQYRKIAASARGLGEAWLLLQSDEPRLPASLKDVHIHTVSQAQILEMGYPMLGPSLIPGHVHFPLLHFYREHPDYSYYWLIEYDVRFSGNWRRLFDAFAQVEADFIAAHIYLYDDEPGWPRWELAHPRDAIPVEQRLRCFHPICRLSGQALAFVCAAHADGWRGHSEVLLPTLLYKNGFSLVDFGGSGKFVLPGMQGGFYIDSPPNRKGALETGTLRYRPAFIWPGFRKDMPYHPVKSAPVGWRLRLRAFMDSLLGKRAAFEIVRSLKALSRRNRNGRG